MLKSKDKKKPIEKTKTAPSHRNKPRLKNSDTPAPNGKSEYKETILLFSKMLMTIFLCETAIMILLHIIPLSRGWEIFADSFFLTALGTLILYGLFVRPVWLSLKQRNLALESLRLSERNLIESQKIANLGSWEINLLTNEEIWSDQIYHLLGFEPGEVSPCHEIFLSSVHPDDREMISQAVQKAISENKPYEMEFRVVRKDGTERIMHSRGEINFDESGKPVRIVGMGQDITERKKAERDLLLARQSIDDSGEGIYWIDKDARVVNANLAGCRQLGFSKEELFRMAVHDFDPNFPKERWPSHWEELRQKGSISFETHHRHKSGNIFPVEVRLSHIKFEDKEYNFAFAKDITERKKAEKKLWSQTKLLNSISKAQSMYITIEDPQPVFDMLLETLVSMTESEYGFLDEVCRDQNGQVFKKSLSLSNISWDDESRKLYEQLRYSNLEFRNLSNLAGAPAITSELIIANDPENDTRSSGLPKGHPPIHSYIGIPMFFGGELVGVAGVANRQGGYTEEIASSLSTFISTCAGIIHAIRKEKKEQQIVGALRQSEEKFRKLTETIDDVFWITSLVECEKIEYVSEAFRKIWGKEPEELYKNSRLWIDTIHPDDRRKIVKRFEGFIQGINDYDVEYRILRDDNSIRWIWDRGFRALDDKNQVTRIMGLAQDITESKKTEQAIRKSENLYRTLVESNPYGIQEIDTSGIITYTNPAYQKILGYTKQELLGKSILDLFEPESKRDELKDYLSILAREQPKPTTYYQKNRTKDNRIIYMAVDWNYKRDNEGYIIGFTSVITDITESKKTEEALQISEAQFRNAFESSGIGMGLVCLDGSWLKVNETLCKMVGYSESEMLTKTFQDITHPDDLDEDLDYVRRLLADDISNYDMEKRYIHKDGHDVWIILSVSLVRDNQGNPMYFVSQVNDITERKKAEEKLNKQQYYLTKAQEIGNIGTWELDVPKNILTWTDENYRIFGVPLDTELNYEIFLNCVHPDDRDNVHEKWSAAIEGEPYDIEHRLVVDGQVKWVREKAEVIFDEAGKALIGIGFTQDITEQKMAKKELQESELRYRNIVQDQTEFIVRWQPNGILTFVNDSYCRYFGKSREELIGSSFFQLISEKDIENVKKRLESLRMENPISSEEHRVSRRDGSIGWNYWTDRAIFDQNGKLIEFQSVGQDITDRKQAEQKILDDQAQLKSLASELSITEERERRRIATELHDQIGQSLVFSKIKLDELHQSASSSELTKSLDEICNNIGQIIQDTRSLTFDLSSPILNQFGLEAAVADWLDVQIGAKHSIETEFEDDGRQKHLDDDIQALLFRNVRELLINVVKHANAKKVKVSIRRVNEHIHIEVEDDGKGFDSVKITSRAVKDTKFGLFSIKERLEQLGGHFEIDSEPGRGSKFSMTTPLKLAKKR